MPKISELPECITPAANDFLPIVDTSNASTNKITLNNLRNYIDSSAYPTLAEADTAALTEGKLLVITKPYDITSDTTLSSNVMIIYGGMLNVSSGVTLTIRKPDGIDEDSGIVIELVNSQAAVHEIKITPVEYQLLDAVPTGTGTNDPTYKVGNRIIKKTPVIGEPKGWRCTVGGKPGTWVSEGNL